MRASGTAYPYAAVPHDLAFDPRLTSTAVQTAIALLSWARAKDRCWPSDPTIGAKIGRSVGTVQRALKGLEAAGWIVREKTAANRTGRIIRLAWRAGARPPLPTAPDPTPPPARDEGEAEKRDAANPLDAALLGRLKSEGLPELLARRFAGVERAEAARRVLANAAVLKATGRLTNPAGYIRAGIEAGYALLPAAAARLDAERRAADAAARNASAALERARAEAERLAEARAEAAALAATDPRTLAALVARALAELPPPLTGRDPTLANPFVRARVVGWAVTPASTSSSRTEPGRAVNPPDGQPGLATPRRRGPTHHSNPARLHNTLAGDAPRTVGGPTVEIDPTPFLSAPGVPIRPERRGIQE